MPLPFPVVLNSAAVNIEVHVSFLIRVFSRYIPRRWISISYGNSTYSFLRNLYTVLIVAAPISMLNNIV